MIYIEYIKYNFYNGFGCINSKTTITFTLGCNESILKVHNAKMVLTYL